MAIHFDLVYMPASVEVEGHPGARSMGTTLIGAVQLENREKVFVTALPRPIQESLRIHIEKLRSARLRYADGREYEKKMACWPLAPNRTPMQMTARRWAFSWTSPHVSTTQLVPPDWLRPNRALELTNAGDFGSAWRALRACRIVVARLQFNAIR